MTIKEKQELCAQAFIAWMAIERDNRDMAIHDKDVEEMFTSQIILKKFQVFNIDIILPDMLLLILNVCVNGNPGQVQIVLKDLLNSIKKRKGPIPPGYVVTSDDFSLCFMADFPIIEIPKINDKYEKLWDGQKYVNVTDNNDRHRYNACDTPEWWKEVMM